ncbi:MAG TPA: alpha/beta fold hydrolase [Kofleriaceae bacterium]|nr:alpha/beta fold hydrolase [Kofleriaceae bacterium]
MTSPPPRAGHLEHRGCRLSYLVVGDGPPVVLIQGVGVGGAGWRPQVDGLRARWRCLSFDNRGFGASQPLGDAVTVELMARDVLALMDAEGWETAHLAAHSLGGLVAVHVARVARARVRSLSLLCTFPSGRIPTQLSPWLVWIGLRMQLGTRRMRRRAFLEVVMPERELLRGDRDALAERLAPLFGHDLADQPPVVRRQLAAMRAYDATSFLQELAGIPTLVVSAAHDRIAPPSGGRTLAAGIAGARYVELPDASHGAPIQLPEQINQLLHEHWSAAESHRRA